MSARLSLFESFGIELEYMIVDSKTLNLVPIADKLLGKVCEDPTCGDVEFPEVSWSNEIVKHVIEFKTTSPRPDLDNMVKPFSDQIKFANELLGTMGAKLLPTAMHPWMNPATETEIWPHENTNVYQKFDQIFGCRGHGWSNLQSMHINLPFADEHEFKVLHDAIRVLLPIIPALAASSPIVELHAHPCLDARMDFYEHNADRIPSICAGVIPEAVDSIGDYKKRILSRIYSDLNPLDQGGILHNEWVNARGAIARFSRGAIEIRVIDIQECPLADLSIAQAIIAVLRSLVEERYVLNEQLHAITGTHLKKLFRSCVTNADLAIINDKLYLSTLGVKANSIGSGELWGALIEREMNSSCRWYPIVDKILKRGCLSRSILEAINGDFSRENIQKVYERLAQCLDNNTLFTN